MPPRFDLALFTSLNEEYATKPLVPSPRKFDPASMAREAEKRTTRLDRHLDLRGKRVLEIGCGTGSVGRQLAERFDCTVVGIDIDRYPAWDDNSLDRVSYLQGDISSPPEGLGSFDAMFSFSVWEHLVHPHAALERCFELLAPGGRMFLQAQLHRGPKASHRYREIFFPWPHLLFTPQVFEEYYESIGREPRRPAWVNKLTCGQYIEAIERVGFATQSRSTPVTVEFDEDFYQRFHDELSAYPRWDLRHDVLTTVITRPQESSAAAVALDRTLDGLSPEPSTVRKIWRSVPASVRDHPLLQRGVRMLRSRRG
ncbi:MAG: class I SAM-dependent methyltransferase [Acidimicrobiales bacterium]